jgi:hypothetical protein
MNPDHPPIQVPTPLRVDPPEADFHRPEDDPHIARIATAREILRLASWIPGPVELTAIREVAAGRHPSGRPWSIGSLARELGCSRSVVARALASRPSKPAGPKPRTLWYWRAADGRTGGPCGSQALAWQQAGHDADGEPVSLAGARVERRTVGR